MPDEVDWKKRHGQLAEYAKEVFGIVFSQLTDPERDLSQEERILCAANEVQCAYINIEAREIFDASGMDDV